MTADDELEPCTLTVDMVFKHAMTRDFKSILDLEITRAHINSIDYDVMRQLTNVKVLDLSFNMLTRIEQMDTLTNLRKLTLANNEISEIDGLAKQINLKYLNLSANKIRKIENIK